MTTGVRLLVGATGGSPGNGSGGDGGGGVFSDMSRA
jgi:hypothetical protein